ncbi:Ig-like domain-containing protein [Ramlibacter sp. MMS24-I3-19]|uniref:Ig-like domain-containing protein n=1 Tax=Ramlibacter sp. MMS24-I3-19 TaxID=3416606 RepID=UPI003D07F06C
MTRTLQLTAAIALLAWAAATTASAATTVNLTAQRATASMPNGASIPMWQFCGQAVPNADGTASAGSTAGGGTTCTGKWAPGPTITVPAGDTLTINLSNTLKVPTSIVVLGQLGGGLGNGTRMPSPPHNGQTHSTFPSNGGPVDIPFVPPAQPSRIASFGTAAPASGTATLVWTALKPGTYIYETGTLPSIEAPMGLYGMLVVTKSPFVEAGVCTPGDAYPPTAGSTARVPYDSDAALLFSEIDPAQNAQVDRAERAGTDITANLRPNDPGCTPNCFPAAVNYTPTYFLINGQPFDRTAPAQSSWNVGEKFASGNVLVRMANAGLRTHIPSIVGLPMALMAEDGNVAPGKPKVQNEVLLTAGKTHDVIVSPAADNGAYKPATFAVFDRQGSLSTDNHVDGGMQGYLLVNGAGASAGSPGTVPAAATAYAVNDAFSAPLATVLNGNVKTNDVGVKTVAVVQGVRHGTLVLSPDGSFVYTPQAGFHGMDMFAYSGNDGQTNIALVMLKVGSDGQPVARDDSFSSNVATLFRASSPGLLANDSDPTNYKLTVDTANVVNGAGGLACTKLSVKADGSFVATPATGASACQFTYRVVNSQGTTSEPATVYVSFATGSGLQLNVVDAKTGTPLNDYRWVLQEDLTFKHDITATPSLTTRTLGTSFHRSYNPVVASGCVGAVSCGSGQQTWDAASAQFSDVDTATPTSLADVLLDPTRHYYVSVLPGDAQNPVLNGGGGPVDVTDASGNTTTRKFDIAKDCHPLVANAIDATDPCGHMMGAANVDAKNSVFPPVTIALQRTPLVPAQLSVFVYEDSAPANGQYDEGEVGLGGFSVILSDPAARTGDPAGQQTYDAFNMPITNALLGSPGCPNEQNTGAAAAAGNNVVGAVYTCPNAPPGYRGDPARYALAGHALIQNLTPARYDVIVHPSSARMAAGEVWWQTETLEGTPAQDAFTGVNEPVYFQEFGPPGFHTTVGLVNPAHVAAYKARTNQVGPHTVLGKITNLHMSRPSNTTLYDAGSYDMLSSTNCYITLNPSGGTGATIGATACDPDGQFRFDKVPAGNYEIQVFDQWLDQIMQVASLTVPDSTTPQTVDMGNVPVLSWFTQLDLNQLLDDGSGQPKGLANQNLVVRYRNGSISNQTLTDPTGNGLLPELFPLFNWYVTESDMTRYKQKSVNIVVDGGGAVDTTGPYAGLMSTKYPTGESSIRTETPGAIAYGTQGFISQRTRIEWIKAPYASGENGGIQGTVVLSSTRAFDDQRLNVQTIWEPLIPRVKVNLYQRQKNMDGSTSLVKVDSTMTSSWDDWVNTVYGADGNTYVLGPDQKMRDAAGVPAPSTAYPPGRQANMQCPGQLPGPASGAKAPFDTTKVDPFTTYTLQGDQFRCYDGFHNWNQMQAAPYDGLYQFPSAAYIAAHKLTAAQIAAGHTLVSLPAGEYVVEVEVPTGFELVKEEDKNILIGDAFIAPVVQQFGGLGSIFILPDQATLNNANLNNTPTGDPGLFSNPTTDLGTTGAALAMPECVGDLHRVPAYLSVYPQVQQVAPFAGMDRPLCDKKLVKLGDQMQAKANFFVFTQTPIAANVTGMILDDAASEFNAASPDFGEKASVPFVPVSTKDFAGHEISRVYSDQWGTFNMLLPSSWLVNPPTPSGYGPSMLVNCMNDPGPIPDPSGAIDPATGKVRMITDPAYNPAYSNFCYTWPFMPGQTTYLDTPVLPIAAHAAGYNPADCEYPDATPAILRVDSSTNIGPYVPVAGGTLTIQALGDKSVLNPAYSGPFATGGLAAERNTSRHYGFGGAQGTGTVRLTGLTWTGNAARVAAQPTTLPLAVTSWADGSITVRVPALPTGITGMSGQLEITTGAGKTSIDAVTVTQEATAPTYVRGANGDTIQAAIDNAKPGDLLMVDAGFYNELVVMWKPVRLQGVGAASVIINAAKYPTSKLAAWRPLVNAMFGINAATGDPSGAPQVDPLPGQEITGGVVLLEPSVLGTEEGAGITVLAKGLRANGTPLTLADCKFGRAPYTVAFDLENGARTRARPQLSNFLCAKSRIDGLSVTGGDSGGGIYVNGWAHNLEIANNRVYGNAGAFHGGVRVGVPYLETNGYAGGAFNGQIAGFGYDKSVRIHHNAITKNGVVEGPVTTGGAGGGVSICTGTDGYSVDHNWICGNYSSSDGGGIGHLGFSQGGQIVQNKVLFNQSFQQTQSTHGGGIFVGGEPPSEITQSLGTGNVLIDGNVIRGNFAEAGHGGGIRLQQVNGADVQRTNNTRLWNTVTVTHNIIDNNVAGWSGGGISMLDTLVSKVSNNTIASNDAVGVAGPVVTGIQKGSTNDGDGQIPQVGTGTPAPAGISSQPTSALLRGAIPNNAQGLTATQRAISSPTLTNNAVWANRSFLTKAVNGNAQLCASNNTADRTTADCVSLPDQTATGQCTGTPAYWDLGVVGDATPASGTLKLNPVSGVLTSTQGYDATNTSVAPAFPRLYCNGSRVTPELGAVINPPSVLNMAVGTTVDEGANYVNVRFGPLTVAHPQSKAAVGNYQLPATSTVGATIQDVAP